jgi:translation initiation factor 5B
VMGSLHEPVVSRVKALFEPSPLIEMGDKKIKFTSVKKVSAAIGVKVSGTGLDKVVSGMPIRSCLLNEVDKIKEELKKEVEEVIIETDQFGIVIKADSLGSLEALEKLLREHGIKIKKASIGHITKKDISDANINFEKDPLDSVILGFNVELGPDVKPKENVKVITSYIIYKLIEELQKWQEGQKKKMEAKEIDCLVKPCKLQLMKGYIFRQNNPAVVGADILAGTLMAGTPLMKSDGNPITEAKSIQQEQKTVEKAEKGVQIAVSLPNVTVGRQIREEDYLYSAIPEEHFKKFKEFKKLLSEEEKSLLKEIAEIMRQNNPVWGI